MLTQTTRRGVTRVVASATPAHVGLSRTAIPLAGASRRTLASTTTSRSHENPLGLPRNNQRLPPTMPRRGGPPQPRRIPHVKHVVCVSSGKGGVGKSTISSNLAVALALTQTPGARRTRVGLLDLDIFGPSVPKLMGLEGMGEAELTRDGALIPLTNHGVRCMSMGFLLGNMPDTDEEEERVVAWRGMMVMKATQQLLFDVDWRQDPHSARSGGDEEGGLDVLVIDMPPGTGDVALSLAQLVEVDAALVVTTPQEVALLDARKGVAMFRKTNVPVAGLVLNMSHFVSPDTGRSFELFGNAAAVERYAEKQKIEVLARIPLQPHVSAGGDRGTPVTLRDTLETQDAAGTTQVQDNLIRTAFVDLAQRIWTRLQS